MDSEREGTPSVAHQHAPENVGRLLAKRLRQLRIARGLSQTEAARRADVARGTWNRWEAGIQSPTAAHVPTIAVALAVEVDDIFDFAGPEPTARAA